MSRIKFGSVREDDIPRQPLPGALLGNQSIAAGSLFVLLDQGAWQKIKEHAARFLAGAERGGALECAGLLAGHAYYDPDRQVTVVEVRAAVETQAESQGPGSVRIAPQDFHAARQQIDQQGMRVVGWYHTHPNYGIFLSSDDKLVIQSLFNASYHVALVYDPIRNEVGCFYSPQCMRVDDSDQVISPKRNFMIVTDWSPPDTSSTGGGQSRRDERDAEDLARSPLNDTIPAPAPLPRGGGLTVDPDGNVPSQGVGPDYSPSANLRAQETRGRREPHRPLERQRSRGDQLPLLLAGGALLLIGLLAGILITNSSFFLQAAPMPGRRRRRPLLYPLPRSHRRCKHS